MHQTSKALLSALIVQLVMCFWDHQCMLSKTGAQNHFSGQCMQGVAKVGPQLFVWKIIQ